MKQPIFELVTIGNELLIGKILNTNAHWLAKRITSFGGSVSRVIVVGDDIGNIVSAINDALGRRPDFVITIGGLGPTFDDKTLEAISKALGRQLELNKQAYKLVKEKYLGYYEVGLLKKFELTPSRLKMAKLPAGAKPLQNPVGTAPGVLLEHKGTILIALPGVTKEMQGIFESDVATLVKRYTKNLFSCEESLRITGIVESEIAPLIDVAMRENPHVYIKSHPKAAEPTPLIELHLTATSDSEMLSKNRVGKAIESISGKIIKKGGAVELLPA